MGKNYDIMFRDKECIQKNAYKRMAERVNLRENNRIKYSNEREEK